MVDGRGVGVFTQREINSVFVDYYEELYAKPIRRNEKPPQEFLEMLSLNAIPAKASEGIR